jgi:SAM-dependent methyltransferase
MTAPIAEYLEWDTQNWSVALDFWKQHTTQRFGGSRALEIGGRHGGLSLWLAHQGAEVICSDKGGPSERARARHERGGVTEHVTYEDVDATRIPYEEQFDVVVFKSVLGSVGRVGGREAQAAAIREMHKALRPGGELFFAENLCSSPLHRYARRRFVKWGARWRYVSIADMREFMTPFSEVFFKTVGFAAVFGRTPAWRRALGSLDRLCLSAMVPPAWRYIIVGLARK